MVREDKLTIIIQFQICMITTYQINGNYDIIIRVPSDFYYIHNL